MIRGVILDTGPLIALIDRRDQFHDWAKAQFHGVDPPLSTCEPVITEALVLARHIAGGQTAIFSLLERKIIRLAFHLEEHLSQVSALLDRYRQVPMSLADACLVRMSETVSEGVVLTLDSDWRIYRRHRRQSVPLLIPPNP